MICCNDAPGDNDDADGDDDDEDDDGSGVKMMVMWMMRVTLMMLMMMIMMMMMFFFVHRCHVRIYSRPEFKKEKQIGDTCMENWRCVEHTPQKVI